MPRLSDLEKATLRKVLEILRDDFAFFSYLPGIAADDDRKRLWSVDAIYTILDEN